MSAAELIEVRAGRPSGYTTIGDWVLLAPISDRAVRVYGLLRMHCGAGDLAWPSQRTLADMLGIKKTDTIAGAVKELIELGAVDVDTIQDANGRHNRYTVHQAPPPGYDQGPRDRTCYYAERGGYPEIRGHPFRGGYPEIRGHPYPQISGLKQYKKKQNK